MPDKRKIYVLGITQLDEDEDEAVRDLGQGIALTGKQLVTAKGLTGVAQAAAWGFHHAGGGDAEWISTGTIPASRDVIIIGDHSYHQRVRDRVPDVEERGWLFVRREDLFQFHLDTLKALAEKGVHLPKYRQGGGGDGGVTRK